MPWQEVSEHPSSLSRSPTSPWESLLGVLIIRAPLFEVYIGAPNLWKLLWGEDTRASNFWETPSVTGGSDFWGMYLDGLQYL